jgi:hypothetical protein
MTIELATHFRSTRRIAEFWQTYYSDSAVSVGHKFTGIAPESIRFDRVYDCIRAMENRIRRLVVRDGCSVRDFAICFASDEELFGFVKRTKLFEMLSVSTYNRRDGVFEYYLKRPELDAVLQLKSNSMEKMEFNDEITRVMDDWEANFIACFEARCKLDYDRSVHYEIFCGISLIVFEFRRLQICCKQTRRAIDNVRFRFLKRLRALEKAGLEVDSGDHFKDAYDILNLDRFLSNKHTFTLTSYNEIYCYRLQDILQRCLDSANDYLTTLKSRSGALDWLSEYFLRFRIVDTWPQLLDNDQLPSKQFPIVCVFVSLSLRTEAIPDFNHHYMSLAMSRLC